MTIQQVQEVKTKAQKKKDMMEKKQDLARNKAEMNLLKQIAKSTAALTKMRSRK